MIGHTQPRRIAARTVAERIAEELERRARRGRRLQGALHRPVERRHPRQADDRRHPARRDPARPRPARVRHDHHRRGPRAQPQHRLPARLPQAAAAAPPRPQGHHHLGDDRPGALRPALRGTARPPDRRGLGPHLSGRGPLPAARRPRGRGRRSATRSPAIVRRRRGALDRGRQGDILVFLSGEREIRDTADALGTKGLPAAPRSCRCTPGCPPPSSTASSASTPAAGSCWPPTSPRPR